MLTSGRGHLIFKLSIFGVKSARIINIKYQELYNYTGCHYNCRKIMRCREMRC